MSATRSPRVAVLALVDERGLARARRRTRWSDSPVARSRVRDLLVGIVVGRERDGVVAQEGVARRRGCRRRRRRRRRPRLPRSAATRWKDGNSIRHGPHHDAHLLTTTGCPRSARRRAAKASGPPGSSSAACGVQRGQRGRRARELGARLRRRGRTARSTRPRCRPARLQQRRATSTATSARTPRSWQSAAHCSVRGIGARWTSRRRVCFNVGILGCRTGGRRSRVLRPCPASRRISWGRSHVSAAPSSQSRAMHG